MKHNALFLDIYFIIFILQTSFYILFQVFNLNNIISNLIYFLRIYAYPSYINIYISSIYMRYEIYIKNLHLFLYSEVWNNKIKFKIVFKTLFENLTKNYLYIQED